MSWMSGNKNGCLKQDVQVRVWVRAHVGVEVMGWKRGDGLGEAWRCCWIELWMLVIVIVDSKNILVNILKLLFYSY